MQKPSKKLGFFNKVQNTREKRWCCFCRNSESLLTFVNTLGPNGRAGLNWLVTEDAYSKKGTCEGNCLQQARNLPAKTFKRQTV